MNPLDLFRTGTQSRSEESEHWLSVSDLMSGLMMVFLLISVGLMIEANKDRDKANRDRDRMREIADTYQNTRAAIYKALKERFGDRLDEWQAEITENLEFKFKGAETLFASQSADLLKAFKERLEVFFPEYLEVLDPFREKVKEVRIEGHSSSEWSGAANQTAAYFLNMELSQARTRAVLEYAYEKMPEETADDKMRKLWVKSVFAAVGFSSSRPALKEGSQMEDPQLSRRVVFTVLTNADAELERILDLNGEEAGP